MIGTLGYGFFSVQPSVLVMPQREILLFFSSSSALLGVQVSFILVVGLVLMNIMVCCLPISVSCTLSSLLRFSSLNLIAGPAGSGAARLIPRLSWSCTGIVPR